MSEEKKEGGCCGTQGSHGSCCGAKKMLFLVAFGAVLFVAGIFFAKNVCQSKDGMMCPIPVSSMQK